MARLRTYGWDAVRLSDLTFEELNELREMVVNDPASANPAHANGNDVHLYTKAARKKLDALSWAVFYKKQEASKAGAA